MALRHREHAVLAAEISTQRAELSAQHAEVLVEEEFMCRNAKGSSL